MRTFMRKFIYCTLVILLVVAIVFLSSEVIRITWEYRQGEKAYSALEEFVSIPAPEETEETIVLEKNVNEQIKETSVTEETISETEPEIQWPSVDFDGL